MKQFQQKLVCCSTHENGCRSSNTSNIYDKRAGFHVRNGKVGGVTLSRNCCGLVTNESPILVVFWENARPAVYVNNLIPSKVFEMKPWSWGGWNPSHVNIIAVESTPTIAAAAWKLPEKKLVRSTDLNKNINYGPKLLTRIHGSHKKNMNEGVAQTRIQKDMF